MVGVGTRRSSARRSSKGRSSAEYGATRRGSTTGHSAADERKANRPDIPFMFFVAVTFWIAICVAAEVCWQNFSKSGFAYDLGQTFVHGLAQTFTQSFANDPSQQLQASSLLNCLLILILIVVCVLVGIFVVLKILKHRYRKENKYGNGCEYGNDTRVPTLVWVCIAAFVCGYIVGCACWMSFDANLETATNSSNNLHVEVVSDPTNAERGWYSLGKIVNKNSILVRVMWQDEADILPFGYSFVANGRISTISNKESGKNFYKNCVSGRLSPTTIQPSGWAKSLQGVFGSIRHKFSQMIDEQSGDGAQLLKGVVLGDRSKISGTELDESFKITGLSHLLAVSGSHLATVAMFVSWIFSKTKLSRRISMVCLCAILGSYLVLTGMQPSAFRSCVMAFIASFSFLAGRRSHSLSALCVASVAMLVLDPTNAFSVGFALSVLGVFGICMFLPLADEWVKKLLPKRFEVLSIPISMTVVAQAATMPVSVPLFSMCALGGPFANVVASPLITFVLGGGILAMMVSALLPFVGSILIFVLAAVGDFISQIVNAMAQVPYMAIPVYAQSAISLLVGALVAIFLWVVWPHPPSTRRQTRLAFCSPIACIAAMLFVVGLLPKGVEIVVMDVGQGDSILVRDGNKTLLVDTGQYDSTFKSALARNGVLHLDAVALTHFDADHVGALGAAKSLVSIDNVMVAKGSNKLAKQGEASAVQTIAEAKRVSNNKDIVELCAGDKIEVGSRVALTVVWPTGEIAESDNADSLCFLMECDIDQDEQTDARILLTGDAESPQLAKIVSDQFGTLANQPRIDVLKVGHHGSADSVDDSTLSALSPKIALISVGANNRYGHPKKSTLDALAKAGVKTYRTDVCGDITLKIEKENIQVHCDTIKKAS